MCAYLNANSWKSGGASLNGSARSQLCGKKKNKSQMCGIRSVDRRIGFVQLTGNVSPGFSYAANTIGSDDKDDLHKITTKSEMGKHGKINKIENCWKIIFEMI